MLNVIKSKQYITNKNLLIIQSKLFSPSYAGPGKWVIYNPDTKKALLAVGKDKLPDIIPLLTEASQRPISNDLLDEDQTKKILDHGLLVEAKDNDMGQKPINLVERYHRAVFNYPFRDYYEKDWKQKDIDTMNHYAKLWEPPSIFTKRNGEKIHLNDINTDELRKQTNEITLNFISSLLRSVFGPLKVKGTYPNQLVRKISPSGGGKHPTEAVIFLNKDYGNVNKGVYTYDIEEHALIPTNSYSKELMANNNNDTISILIRARVERPMWRYREIRSYRAVMIDAGHVIENIRQICEYKGIFTKISTSKVKYDNITDFEWVHEPELCFIEISPSSLSIKEINEEHSATEKIQSAKRNLTNPSLYFSFENGRLICNTLWPTISSTVINYKDFEILTHCLPSRRGDRDISERGIFKEFLINKSDYEKLIHSHALLPENLAKKMYEKVTLWSNHNWYLNFLLYCEVRNSKPQLDIKQFRNNAIVTDPTKLFLRRTNRKFNDKTLPEHFFEKLLNNSIPIEDSESIDLVVNVKNVDGIPPGLYLWSNSNLEIIGDALTPSQVRSMVIGQKWAGTGAVDIWITSNIDFSKPETYEQSFIKLGQVGQRICITCTEDGVSTFMTPAVKDIDTLTSLNKEHSLNTVFYHLTIGYKGE